MQSIDLLVQSRWLLPMEPADAVLEHHALAVHGGRIVDVLPQAQAAARYEARETLELSTHALMPGLVNTHTHAAMSLLRGLADDLPLMDWLQQHIWPAEAAHVGRAFCEDGVRLALAEMIRGGTTCFNDMYYFPDVSAEVALAAGMRAVVGLIVLDFPTVWAQNADEYLHKGLEVHDRIKGQPLLRAVFAPHAPYTVSDAPLRKLRGFATELGIGIHMHVHETADEVAASVQATGKRPWQRLKELELFGPDFIAVHMTQLTDREIAETAQFGVHVAHCPESNLKLASGFCPVGRLLQAGANVALGTDGAASNNDLDMLGELRTAALLAKGVAADPRTLPAAQALRMATLDGARALGLDAEIGSLVKGKQADFIAVELCAAATQPVYHLASQLVYSCSRGQVSDVFVGGRALMRQNTLTTLDELEIVAKANRWRQKICP